MFLKQMKNIMSVCALTIFLWLLRQKVQMCLG